MDTVESESGTMNFKVNLPDGTIVYHAVYDNGSNKAFVIHVKEVLSFCKRKNYYKYYKKYNKYPSSYNVVNGPFKVLS